MRLLAPDWRGTLFALYSDAMDQDPSEKPKYDSERAIAQIERLVDAFSDELQKLNESLQVLTAHLERLRTDLRKEETRIH